MKRHVIGVIVGSSLATALVAAQGAAPATSAAMQQGAEKSREVTLTGCLIQGSAPAIFLLEDARANPQDQSEKARTYFLSAAITDLRGHLNKEVKVAGLAEMKTVPDPPAGKKVAEQDLPKLSVKSIAAVADRCPSLR